MSRLSGGLLHASALLRRASEPLETHIELIESALGANDDGLLEGRADPAIAFSVPQGFVGDPVMQAPLIAVAHPEHTLHRILKISPLAWLALFSAIGKPTTGKADGSRATPEPELVLYHAHGNLPDSKFTRGFLCGAKS